MKTTRNYFTLGLLMLISAVAITAQSSTFTYQGKLTDNGVAANGSYDIEFRLFDIGSGGSALAAQQKLNVPVESGMFAVALDFGPAAFDGSSRYIELAVRPAGAGSFTTMSPRAPISSTPYAIKSLTATTADNAAQLGGVNAGSFVQTNDARLSDARLPTAGSPSYIQNTNNPQANSNFNVSGNGTVGGTLFANFVNAVSGYNISGSRILAAPGLNNTFAGIAAGSVNTTGFDNAFFGTKAGFANSGGSSNSFFGAGAGEANVFNGANSFFGTRAGQNTNGGNSNSFFGFEAGKANTSADANSFFGARAGANTTTGQGGSNAFFGAHAGETNTIGSLNSFLGSGAALTNTIGSANVVIGGSAGINNSEGSRNVFVGTFVAETNTIGSSNTIIGYNADVAANNLTNATAIGAHAVVSQNNSLVLGGISGINEATSSTNVGIGTTAPSERLHIAANGGNVVMGDPGCSPGFAGIGFGASIAGCANYSLLGEGTNTILNRPSGGSISFRENNAQQVSINPGGTLSINTLGSAGSTQLCRNASNQVSTCSSSLRYKKDMQPFIGGLAMLDRLKPITFRWKSNDMLDLGFGAEDVAKVEPLLVSRNDQGEIEGVKYDRISAVLVNAVKEQQAVIDRQQTEIDALKQLVCKRNRKAQVCRE